MVRIVQTFPLATPQRGFLARVPFIVLYILSLPFPFCQFSPPLIFRPFSTPPLLRAAPSPRRPSLSLRSPRPFRSFRSIRPIRPIRLIRAIIRVQKKFLSASCAKSPSKLSPALYKPHGKASAIPLKSRKNADFLKFFESKSCTVQKVAVLLHSLTEKNGGAREFRETAKVL